MRLDLKKDVEAIKRNAIKEVVVAANAAHDDLEYETGYSWQHSVVGDPDATMAIARHAIVLKIRHEAVSKIKSANSGSDIKKVVDGLRFS